MKKCGYCGRENEDVAGVCAECGTEFGLKDFVSAGARLRDDPAMSLITVATFANTVDAEMFKMHLQGAGIEAGAPEDASFLEDVAVRVAAKDLEAAKVLYHVFSGEPAPAGANLEQLPSSETIAIESKIDDDSQMMIEPLLQIDLPGVKKVKSGKVREMFDLGDRLLLVATDRISAFDCVMPNGIPRKGEVLTQISFFWFDRFASLVPNHLLAWPDDPLPPALLPYAAKLARRSMIVKKAKPLAIECVVRGYLAGSGWQEYRKRQTVCGIKLPPGLQESSELPEPIFTPATKAETGHDENISFEQASEIVGPAIANRAREASLKIYTAARNYAEERGIIIADTKFEFGLADGEMILIDEVLTPDSSRFWPADQYQAGRSQPSFDKQFVRDYLETLSWNKTPPAPALPPDVVAKTQAKYLEAYEKLTGKAL